MKRAGGTLVALCVLLIAGAGRADTPPNTWDIARDPGAKRRWELHVHVTRLLEAREAGLRLGGMRNLALEHARALLESADAAASPDVRLRFDLGVIYELTGRHSQAIAVLEPAVEAQPDAAGVDRALLSLAYAYARLDMPHEEIRAYKRYLAKAMGDANRATARLNLAEAEMRVGNLPDAIAGYRESQAIAAELPSPSGALSSILAVWGLAVALDRAGDPTGAAQQAKLAVSLDPDERIIGDESANSNVFFEPKRERYWYTALGAQEDAKAAPDARTAVEAWTRAVKRWSTYVSMAEAAAGEKELPDWLPLARAHRDAARKELAAAQKRLAREPRRGPALIDVEEP